MHLSVWALVDNNQLSGIHTPTADEFIKPAGFMVERVKLAMIGNRKIVIKKIIDSSLVTLK